MRILLKTSFCTVTAALIALLIAGVWRSYEDVWFFSAEVSSGQAIEYQLFYKTETEPDFIEEHSLKALVASSDSFSKLSFRIPSKDINTIRLDFGSQPGLAKIKNIELKRNFASCNPDIGRMQLVGMSIETNGDVSSAVLETSDPYMVISGDMFQSVGVIDMPVTLVIAAVSFSAFFILAFVGLGIMRKYGMSVFIVDLIKLRRVIFELSVKDMQNRYLGSNLGIIWAFVQPIVTILIYWFVFEKGLKAAPIGEYPFMLTLISGIIPWFFFSDAISSANTSISDNAFLVKKVVFRVSALPIVRIASALFIHLFFIFLATIVFLFFGYGIDIYFIQIPYYLFALFMLILGLAWLTSAVNVFFKDLGQIISILLQFGFWLTPIFWQLESVPQKYVIIFKLNPVYYIVNGYRDVFLYKRWFWEYPSITLLYWAVTWAVFVIGIFVFKRLRPHFADVI